jgi:hypothetical protein
MFSWIFKNSNTKNQTLKKQKKPPFTCKECGFTCNECDAAPLCYACYSGRDTFCPNCKSEVSKQIT